MSKYRQPSPEDLHHALKIAARVVVLYGETYLPIFNRMHREVEQLKEKEKAESLAFELAKSYADLEEMK